ncbi:MAG: CDGSH iron-sulfur domain-containing protein [Planctomycetota bacterium]|nr:CDGSH iron-sulfur domain-containing protein [Planctomycetota bacterium]
MEDPKIAATSPCQVQLEKGKKYSFCTCGLSESQPFCDGKHKGGEFVPHVFEAEEAGSAFLCACKRTGNAPFCDGTHNGLSNANDA